MYVLLLYNELVFNLKYFKIRTCFKDAFKSLIVLLDTIKLFTFAK